MMPSFSATFASCISTAGSPHSWRHANYCLMLSSMVLAHSSLPSPAHTHTHQLLPLSCTQALYQVMYKSFMKSKGANVVSTRSNEDLSLVDNAG